VFRSIANTVLKRLGVAGPLPAVPPVPAAPPAPLPVRVQRASADAAPAVPGTPSFLGLSRREALTRARASGWDVEVTGVGYVSAQTPAPGAPLATERRLALRLVRP